MIKTEFGIIDEIDLQKDYSEYEPEKYNCVVIDDDEYINDWWEQLELLKTYFDSFEHPSFALSRWGVTLIPPESLEGFQNIVLSDERIKADKNLVALAEKIKQAIKENKFMIHYGV